MRSNQLILVAAAAASVVAQTTSSTSSATDAAPTEVTGCHSHGDDLFCFDGSDEWELTPTEYDADTVPDSFDNCHYHAGVLFVEPFFSLYSLD